MGVDRVLAEVGRLTAATEAMAALGARLRLPTDGGAADPAVVESLDRVVALLLPDGDAAGLDDLGRAAVVGAVHAFLAQALELVEDPGRSPGWRYDDPSVLRSQGRLSAVIPSLIAASGASMPGLAGRLGRPGAQLLDVGCGVGALAMAACAAWPAVHVVGIDPWEPSLALAREDVAGARLDDRIELRAQRVEDLADEARFDLVWLSGPFLPAAVLPSALTRSWTALAPGGWVVLGLYGGPVDPLAEELAALRAIRSGGQRLAPPDAVDRLSAVGFEEVAVAPRSWAAPVQLVVGRRPSP